MRFDRRTFLKVGGLSALSAGAPACTSSNTQRAAEPESRSDYTLRIATGLVDLAPGHIVSTTLYNDQFPGPLLRFKEGQRVAVDLFNDTDTPELVHWHGQMVPSDVDGASEEGTPFVPGRSRSALVGTCPGRSRDCHSLQDLITVRRHDGTCWFSGHPETSDTALASWGRARVGSRCHSWVISHGR